MIEISQSITENINYIFNNCKINISIKRDDQLHPVVSGNKWRKLKYSISKALQNKNDGILTFGGAHSNHLVATAAACKEMGLKSIAYVRGEELNADSNPSLQHCAKLGMELVFVSREEYRLKSEKFYTDELHVEHPNVYIVPEGGSNYYGIIGCSEIIGELSDDITDIVVSAGTGTTAAGLLMACKENQRIHIVSALKGDWMEEEVRRLLMYSLFDEEIVEELLQKANFIYDAHQGGYAKVSEELVDFVQSFYLQTSIKLDPIYTAKSMLWFSKNQKLFKADAHCLFLHTGGVQGAEYMQKKINRELYPV